MVTSRLKSRLSLLFLACTVVLLIFPAMAFAQTAPTIKSDKDDYRPGETVTLTGSNWQPGESVHINVNDDVGQTWSRDADLTADANGNITDQFQLPNSFIATYKVTATGQQSGTATTSFTDGNLTLHLATSEGVGSMSVTYQSFGKNNAPDLTCSTTGSTPGGSPKSVTSGGTASIGIQSFESVKLGNVTTPTPGFVFDRWTTGTATTDSGNTVSGSPNPCIGGSTSGTNGNVTDLYAHFKPSNRAPVANNDSYSVNEDNPLTVAAPGVLANDTDADGDTLTVTNNTSPSHGSVTVNANGSFTYTPANNYNGSDSFNYTVSDGKGGQATGTVNITVNAVNDAPSFTKGADQTVNEDAGAQSVAGWATNISAGPSDESAQTVSFLVTNDNNSLFTSGGQPAVSSNGTLTYTPAPDANGSATVTVRAKDSGGTANGGQDTSAAQTFTITVSAVNDAPVNSVPGNQSVNEDTTLTFNSANSNLISISDVDAGGNAVKVTLGVTHGKLTLSGTSGLTFTAGSNGTANMTFTGTITNINSALSGLKFDPDANYNGPAALTITTDDQGNTGSGGAKTDSDIVNITVNAVNDTPVANNDSYSTNEDNTLTVAAPGVLGNDTDVDGDTLTVTNNSSPSHGTLTLNANGSLTYNPANNYNGPDSFTYTISDAKGGTATATVNITVKAVNDPPVAVDDTATTDEDTAAAINVVANDTDVDGDSLSVVAGSLSTPAHGTAVLITSGADAGKVRYTPDANYNGSDSFKYKVSDGSAQSNEATVSITVRAVNDAPVANNDSYSTDEDNMLTVSAPGVLGNDSDVDSANLTAAKVAGPAHGTVTLNANGSFTYNPDANYNGPDSFTYKANDGSLDSGVATVNITVNPVNDAPTVKNAASDDTGKNEGATLSIQGAFQDAADNDTLTITKTAGAGTLVDNGDGTWSWSLQTNDNVSGTVTVTASDGKGGTVTDTFDYSTVNVAPSATFNAPNSVNEGSDINISLTNPSDPSSADTNAGFQYAFDCGSGYGTFGLSNSASCSTTNDGTRTVKAKIRDKDGGEREYTANVTINNVPPSVTAAADQSSDEGQNKSFDLGSFTDPGADGPWQVAVNWGDNSTDGPFPINQPGSLGSRTHTYADNGTYTVTVTVAEAGSGTTPSDSKTFQVTVNNVAPTGTLGNDGPVNEGSPATISFTGQSDPSSADTAAGFHYAYDCNNGSLASATYANSGSSASKQCTFADNGTYTVRARIIDKDGGYTEKTTDVVVHNVAPSVTKPADDTGLEGTPKSFGLGSFSDPGTNDGPWSVDVNWGDGSQHATFTRASQGPLGMANHAYDDNGIYTVTVTVTDKDGDSGTQTSKITINNVAPTGTLGNNGPINEGGSAKISFTGQSDPSNADTAAGFHYAYHCDGSGFASAPSYSGADTSASTNCSFADNGTYTVKAAIIDKDGGYTVYPTDVTVNNVPPSVTAAANQSSDEGQDKGFSLGSFTDPGVNDGPWAVDVNWGDGSDHTTFTTSSQGSLDTKNHKYADDGSYTVSVKVTDKDGGSDSKSFTANVANVAPTVSITDGPTTVSEDKNGSVQYKFSVSDPGNDSFTVKSGFPDCGSGGTFVTGSLTTNASGGSFNCRFSDGPATPKVRMQVRDADEPAGSTTADSNIATRDVTVNNVAPSVNLSGDTDVKEGTTHTYTYTISDPGDDTFSFVSGYPTCGQYGELVGTPAVGDGSFQCRFPDGPNTTNVAIKIKDDDGGISTPDVEQVDIIAVQIANVAPSVTAPANQSANEGENKSFDLGSFTDPGPDSPWNVDVDWGDGSTHTTFDETATGSVTDKTITAQSHTYADNGNYTVSVKVTDKNGGSDSKTFTVNVANANPVVAAPQDTTGLEGENKSFGLGSFSDAGVKDSPWHVKVDWGDGSPAHEFDATSQGPLGMANHSYDDNGTYSMSVTVADKDGGSDTKTSKIEVDNAAPTATLSNDGPINEGGSATISFSNQSDASSADTSAGFRYAYHCDGTPFATAPTYADAAGSTASTTCSFADNGTKTVRAAIIDKDGGYSVYSTNVVVNNVAPSVTAPADQSASEGDNHAFDLGSFSDAGANDNPWSVDVNWGDGSPHTTFSANSRGPLGSQSHKYADNGSYTVSVKVTDKDGGSDTKSFRVTVNNANPVVAAPQDATGLEGTPNTFGLGSFSDPGANDGPWSVEVNWGDGSPHTTFNATSQGGLGAANHSYDDNGTYSMSVTVTDKDGGSDTKTSKITINNVAPTATFNAPNSVDEGSNINLSLSGASDVSSADRAAGFTYAFDCGDGSGYGAFSANNSASCSTNDSGTRAVKAKVRDKDGGVTEYTGSVTVNNVAPTANFNFPSTAVKEGSSFALSLSGADDVSSVDKAAGFQYAFNCGSGYGAFSANNSANCVPDDGPSTLSVKAQIKDKDGGIREYTGSVSITNDPPKITSITSTSQNALVGTANSVTFTGLATDPSVADTNHGFYWQWALDGGTFGPFGAVNANTFKTSFTSCGAHTVSAQAKDKDGGISLPFTTTYQVNAYDGAYKAPLVDGTVNLVQKGQVVPVKISIGCGTTNLTGLSPRIDLLSGNVSPETESGSTAVTTSVSSADTGQIMRPVDGGYIYNLQVPSNGTAGTQYTIRVNPWGVQPNAAAWAASSMYVVIQLRK